MVWIFLLERIATVQENDTLWGFLFAADDMIMLELEAELEGGKVAS